MDDVFSLPEVARTDFLRSLVHSFGCAYICLWRYDSNLSNLLFFLDGFYNVINNQPSSSLESSVSERLFNQYQRLTFDVNDDCVPGLAFRNRLPYLELQQLDLLRLVSTETQTQFFQEARIKTAVFMGCNKGEIELGFSNISPADIKTALGSLFPKDISIHSQSMDQNPPSSSSSSFISLSTGSPEYSSLLFSIPGTTSLSHFPETLGVVPTMQPTVPASQTSPHQQAIPSLFPTLEGEHDAIIRAMLHVISSPPSSTSHQHQPQQNLPYTSVIHPEATAFKRYRPNITSQLGLISFRRQSLLNRSFAFFRRLNLTRMRELVQATHTTSAQLHHMISERRRREKLNENFQTLRTLLPPGTKKDKASILTTAKETLSSLMAEIERLSSRNQQLITLLSAKESTINEESKGSSSNERLHVRVSHVLESSSSEEQMVDLQVIVRGESSQVDILIRLLEFLKRVQNVSLISTDVNTHTTEETAINQLTFRLRIIEGSEWDESAFQEAVRRVVADLIQWQLDQ
ncbi:putative transcription factor bHLH041 [Gastrolobium bilobum]|uniref:putative transcription factor bHLH041 n=1 Tax=Gastrolobium bilobum TaxID=150636 RepID=UPI002AAF8674|nr:putative transcription factor bHLH041 [Gastrolobium bilobum]